MVLYPPSSLIPARQTIFLAGSIDMGKAPDWQQEVINRIDRPDLLLLNPRRSDWDSSWEQDKSHSLFREQVEWELAGLEQADLIAMYISPTGQAPISLLELGLWARSGKLLVCCPEGYWRKGNVDIVCERYGITQVPDLNALILAIEEKLG